MKILKATQRKNCISIWTFCHATTSSKANLLLNFFSNDTTTFCLFSRSFILHWQKFTSKMQACQHRETCLRKTSKIEICSTNQSLIDPSVTVVWFVYLSLQGGWALLQNCHLGLEFMDELMDTVVEAEQVHDSFRLWMTTEEHVHFPIGLLQVSVSSKSVGRPPWPEFVQN